MKLNGEFLAQTLGGDHNLQTLQGIATWKTAGFDPARTR
jgi:hypothetical protein